jgi:hypothetical protein
MKGSMTMEEDWTPTETAIYALAEAMAYRLDPTDPQSPTREMIARASTIVNATLDIAGRPFVVLLRDCEADAEILAKACGKNGDGHVGEGLRVIEELTRSPRM